jgi:cytochrome bd-type quinol oxidase subunit 1
MITILVARLGMFVPSTPSHCSCSDIADDLRGLDCGATGWYVTEIGRQPWLVYGELRIEQAVAEHGGGMVLSTLVIWLLLYAFVLLSYIATLRHLAKKPSASLLASEQTYPGLLASKEP